MVNNIVSVAVTQTIAPQPNTLQQTGAIISQGGTTAATNSLTLLTQYSSLTSILANPLSISGLVWAGGTVTATTTVPHNLTVSQTYYLTIQGALPTAYNGTYACAIASANTFTYTLAVNPGTATATGTWVSSTQVELQQMATTFFAQGSGVPIYVLELGLGSVTAGVSSLTNWLNNNQQVVYAFVVPREWDANAAFLTLIASYENTTALTYFWVTTTNATYASYTAQMKDVFAVIEAPGVASSLPAGEFSIAAMVWNQLNINPSSTNLVAPFAFTFLYGVTPYPLTGNQTLFANWKAAGVNWVGTGAQGGISTAIVYWGTYMGAIPLNYWYAVDWLQINISLNMNNAVINGSNDPQNPLYLNQAGINTLQAVGASTLSSAISFGMLLGQVVQSELSGAAYAAALAIGTFAGQAVLNAVPFVSYYTVNPGQYATGTYNGFACTVTPLRGFTSITFYVNVTNFVAL